jgi:hypothetical protein
MRSQPSFLSPPSACPPLAPHLSYPFGLRGEAVRATLVPSLLNIRPNAFELFARRAAHPNKIDRPAFCWPPLGGGAARATFSAR